MDPVRPSSPKPIVTPVTEGGLIRPQFSPGYVAGIQRTHGLRRLLLRCLYVVSAEWISVLTLDQFFDMSILFDYPRRSATWGYIWIPSLALIFGIRAVLRRCGNCGSPIGEGYGVTRVVATHSITCNNCSIELQ